MLRTRIDLKVTFQRSISMKLCRECEFCEVLTSKIAILPSRDRRVFIQSAKARLSLTFLFFHIRLL